MEPIVGTVESFTYHYITVVFRSTKVTFKSPRRYLGNVGDTIELISKPVEHSTYPFNILPFDQLFLKSEHKYSVEYWCYEEADK